jgi:hypothetical protein
MRRMAVRIGAFSAAQINWRVRANRRISQE